MDINKKHEEDSFSDDLNHLKEEIKHEGEKIKHLEEELEFEQKEVKHLGEEVEELEKNHHEHDQHKKHELLFIINGKSIKVQVDLEWTLKEAVEHALKQSGNEGRPIEDWNVKYNNVALDLNKRIKEFHFKDCAELFLSLNAGHGGALKY